MKTEPNISPSGTDV